MRVRGPGKFLKVEDREGRVGDGLAEDRLRVRAEGRLQLLGRAVRADKGKLNAHFPHRYVEEVEGTAVDGGARNNVVAAVRDIKDREKVRRLAGGGQHAGRAALKSRDLRGDEVVGRVLEAGVEVAAGLEVKKLRHVLAGVVFEGRALHDRHLTGLAVAGAVAALHTGCFNIPIRHDKSPFSFRLSAKAYIALIRTIPVSRCSGKACPSPCGDLSLIT